MNASKDFILTSVRRHRPVGGELPDLSREWTTYADRQRQFIEMLTAVGGLAATAASSAELNAQLRTVPAYSSGQKIVSLVPGVGEPNVDLAALGSPHALADVDMAILPGEFAVAENAAVWVTDQAVPLRAIYFLCQHLVLVVPRGEIVDHMPAAYDRLAAAGNGGRSVFSRPVFGAFISGPSKTADIEQSLVIGAHGPRSLTVYLLG